MPDQKIKENRASAEKTKERADQGSDNEKLTFFKARRMASKSIYEALIFEAFEDGCIVVGTHMERLVAMEERLLRLNEIARALKDDDHLLQQIFDQAKLVEHSVRMGDCAGRLSGLKILFAAVRLLEPYEPTFNWLLAELYDIVLDVCERLSQESEKFNETKARISYKYGKFMAKQNGRREDALAALQTACELSRTEKWPPTLPPEKSTFESLHEAVAQELSGVYLALAGTLAGSKLDVAMEQAQKAIVVLAEVGPKRSKLPMCRAYVKKFQLLINVQQYEMAMEGIAKLQPQIVMEKDPAYAELKCAIYLQKGICFYTFNETKNSLLRLRRARQISRKHHLITLEADTLLYMGKAYATLPDKHAKAEQSFRKARKLFANLKDQRSVKQIDYMLATLKANEIRPDFLNMLKSPAHCDFIRLLNWKNRCQRFWPTEDGEHGQPPGGHHTNLGLPPISKQIMKEFDGKTVAPRFLVELPNRFLSENAKFELTSDSGIKCLLAELTSDAKSLKE